MVAALTVVALGLSYAVRGEVRAVSMQKEFAVAGALTEAGAILAARELAVRKGADTSLRRFEVTLEGHPVRVQVVPVTGLIDLNAAEEPLLTALMVVAGGVDAARASVLAQRILDWREPGDAPRQSGAKNAAYVAARSPFRTRGGPFEAPEDLLQVLGIDFDLYVKVRPLVTVHQRGSGRVSPSAAPLPVLRVLAQGDEQVAVEYADARETLGALADSTRFPASYVGQSSTFRYVVEASLRLSNEAFLVTRNVIDVSAPQESMPWTTLWTERFVVAADEAT